MPLIALIGTCDTKLAELSMFRQKILDAGADLVTLIDVGRTPVNSAHITISQDQVAQFADDPTTDLLSLPRGAVITHMTTCATRVVAQLYAARKMTGIIAAGGSGGTSLAAAVMRDALPIGFPKLIVSTVASGDTGPYVAECDITMTYSVVDIAGTNPLLERIFTNAAGAIVGMARAYAAVGAGVPAGVAEGGRPRVGITMFGVTTPAVDAIRRVLTVEPYEFAVYVFHATGHGGLAMERLVREGALDAVIDLTTTEVADHIVGGVMSAGPARMEAAAELGIPYLVSVGATDMVNFGPVATVPKEFSDGGRKLYEHNPTVTLMRTSKEECGKIGAFIAEKLSKFAKAPEKVRVVLPTGGVSMIATPGGPFEDQDADKEMFERIEKGLEGSAVEVVRDDRAINDEGFSKDVAMRMVQLLESHGR